MAVRKGLAVAVPRNATVRRIWQQLTDAALAGRIRYPALVGLVILVASWQVTARSEDPNGVAYVGTMNVVKGTGGDLSQYRPLSPYLAIGLEHVFGLGLPPFEAMRFVQCLLIFALAYALYTQLGLGTGARLVGIGLVGGLTSLELGRIGPSAFSLDRFTDTIFFLIAALLVLRGKAIWIPALMILAIANRETSVFIPALIVARDRLPWRHWSRPRLTRPLVVALIAWVVAAVVYVAIHQYYGPRPRTEESYFGPAMVMRSLGMPGQTAFFVASINLLPLLAVLVIRDAHPFLRRAFWMVVPLWFAIHIWAARLGEGIMYLAPLTVIVIPMVLSGLERRRARLDRVPHASLAPVPPA